MRSRHTAPAAAAIVILALSACSGSGPASPAATAPGPVVVRGDTRILGRGGWRR